MSKYWFLKKKISNINTKEKLFSYSGLTHPFYVKKPQLLWAVPLSKVTPDRLLLILGNPIFHIPQLTLTPWPGLPDIWTHGVCLSFNFPSNILQLDAQHTEEWRGGGMLGHIKHILAWFQYTTSLDLSISTVVLGARKIEQKIR